MRLKTILLLSMALFVSADSLTGQEEQKSERDQTVLVHYMPWYATKSVSGQWGWHWTMNHFDPEKIDKDGRREIASHDYPLIGLYDSSDPDALECHVLLMKFSGIDGVIIDWYGIGDLYDYPMNHRNTQRMIEYAKKAGLKYAICYEDQTVPNLVKQDVIKESDEVSHGEATIKWMDENWFHDAAYFKLNEKPILLVFGPQHYQRDAWQQILSAADPRASMFALPHLAKKSEAAGAFGWPPVSGGIEITPTKWKQYLSNLYARQNSGESVIASVFPKFHDIYQQAGAQKTHGFIDDRGGKTFDETLNMAIESKTPLIQIATWNDYGEGTMVEPTQSHGYQYLEKLQEKLERITFTAADLRLPVILYELRKKHEPSDDLKKQLNHASDLLFASKCEEARGILKQVRGADR